MGDSSTFVSALQAALPGVTVDAARLSGLDAFAFVSDVVAPPYLAALAAAADGDDQTRARLAQMAAVVEAGFAGDDDLADALAMRVVERHLCRNPVLLERARPTFGPATARVVAKFEHLIKTADQRVAEHRLD